MHPREQLASLLWPLRISVRRFAWDIKQPLSASQCPDMSAAQVSTTTSPRAIEKKPVKFSNLLRESLLCFLIVFLSIARPV